jgi:hypothetical protein
MKEVKGNFCKFLKFKLEQLGTIQISTGTSFSIKFLCVTLFVTLIGLQPLLCSLLQNATISKMKSDNFKALQKMG